MNSISIQSSSASQVGFPPAPQRLTPSQLANSPSAAFAASSSQHQNHQRHSHQSSLSSSSSSSPVASGRPPCPCQFLHPHRTCILHILQSFGRSFYVAYGIRSGLSLAMHIIRLARTKPSDLLSLEKVVTVKGLPVDAVRMGLFIGGFSALYYSCRCLLTRARGRYDSATVLVSGFVAGSSLTFANKSLHRTFALYLLARVAQCWYNLQKSQGKFHFFGSNWPHGDSLLFILTSAQVLYAYIMNPTTLPYSYWKFMVDTAPIHPAMLEATRLNNRGLPFPLEPVEKYLLARETHSLHGITAAEIFQSSLVSMADGTLGAYPSITPCCALHPHTDSCVMHLLHTIWRAARRCFPVYASVTFVPLFVLRTMSFLYNPFGIALRGLQGTLRSTAFLTAFVSIYQATICAQRNLVSVDHKIVYWIAGVLASASIFIEKKSRRSELALYVLPRAVDSFYMTLRHRHLLGGIPLGEIFLFCVSMAALMYYREFAPESMTPLLRRILEFLVPLHHIHTERKSLHELHEKEKEKEKDKEKEKEKEKQGNVLAMVAAIESQTKMTDISRTSSGSVSAATASASASASVSISGQHSVSTAISDSPAVRRSPIDSINPLSPPPYSNGSTDHSAPSPLKDSGDAHEKIADVAVASSAEKEHLGTQLSINNTPKKNSAASTVTNGMVNGSTKSSE